VRRRKLTFLFEIPLNRRCVRQILLFQTAALIALRCITPAEAHTNNDHTTPRHPPSAHSLHLHPRPAARSPCLGLTYGFVTRLRASLGPTQNNPGPCQHSAHDLTEHFSSPPTHFNYKQGIPASFRPSGTLTASHRRLRHLSPIPFLPIMVPKPSR
jgi:hypothetical protein